MVMEEAAEPSHSLQVHDRDDDNVSNNHVATASLIDDDEAPRPQSPSSPLSDPLQSPSPPSVPSPSVPSPTANSTNNTNSTNKSAPRKGTGVSFLEPTSLFSMPLPLPSISEENNTTSTSTHSNRRRSSFQQFVSSSNILRHRGRKRESVVRNSTLMDQDTGEIITKECVVETIMDHDDADYDSNKNLHNIWSMGMGTSHKPSNSGGKQHYRLHSRYNGRDGGNDMGYNERNKMTNWITSYIHWSFRTSVLGLLTSFTFIFYVLTMMFALVLYLIAYQQPRCFEMINDSSSQFGGDELNFENTKYTFMDVYALSWTTFSTVGYGMVHPTVDAEYHKSETGHLCLGIKMFAAFESFFGILYASFAGAIIFGKVARIQSIARIIWSDPIVVRYGSGVRVVEDEEDDEQPSCPITTTHDDHDHHDTCPNETISCPILEFRIVNQLYNQKGGEIVNGDISLVATVAGETKADRRRKFLKSVERVEEKTVSGAKQKTSPVKASKLAVQKFNARLRNKLSLDTSNMSREGSAGRQTQPALFLNSSLPSDDTFSSSREPPGMGMPIAVDDESSVPHLLFVKLHGENDHHPFFKRVWIVRHRLDEKSPLLSPMAKRMIHRSGGNWPQALNHHSKVRQHLRFHQLIVTFSGTARASGRSVYAHKVYDIVDVNIGYRFANMTVKQENGALIVDHSLINDVAEQHGGGAEPFQELGEEGEIGLLQSSVAFMERFRNSNIGIHHHASRSGNQSSPTNTADPAHMV